MMSSFMHFLLVPDICGSIDSGLLGYHSVLIGKWIPAFLEVLPPSSDFEQAQEG